MTLQALSSQIPFKIGNLTDFKAFFLDMLTEFHLLVPVKIWKTTKHLLGRFVWQSHIFTSVIIFESICFQDYMTVRNNRLWEQVYSLWHASVFPNFGTWPRLPKIKFLTTRLGCILLRTNTIRVKELQKIWNFITQLLGRK